VLKQIAESVLPSDDTALKAMELVVRKIDASSAISWHHRLAANPAHIRLAVGAAGAIGDPVLVPWMISLMNELPLARVAGQSFTSITGVDLAYDNLEGKPPQGFEAGPSDDPKDESVAMDPDENLPWPDPALVAQWWSRHQREFHNGTRYLLGRPISVDWLQQVLRTGRQRQRAAAALELAIAQPGQPLFEVRAPGFRQLKALGVGPA
jgi:uncharacterized protein (TIGR02270 family)